MSVVALNAFASGGVAVSVVTNAGYVGADTVDADASCFVDLSFYCTVGAVYAGAAGVVAVCVVVDLCCCCRCGGCNTSSLYLNQEPEVLYN